jgi:hypothetical protein
MPFAKLFGWNEAGVVACKVFAVFCWVATGPLVYIWMRRGLLIDVGTSFAVAGLAVSLPLFDVMGDITFAMYSCSVLLFWAGWALFSNRLRSQAGSGGTAIRDRLACLGLFLLATTAVVAQDNISPSRKQAIDSLALEKVKDLSKYISIIGSKETQFSEANRVMDRAEELFAPGAEMGVSSINTKEIAYYKVRRYFERLMALNYDRVNITWYDIQYISDLERQPDGRYVGVITIYQRFEGTSIETGMNYKDTTKKDITIYVEKKQTQIAGRTIEFWDVMLGDVRVTETSA